jgi:hypothetical protein
MHILTLIVFALVLVGCASSNTIERVAGSKSSFDGAVYGGELNIVNEDKSGSEQYRVFHQGATGFVSVQVIRESAEKRASDFCEKKSKVFKTLSEHTSQPPHILGNFPRIEIVFICVDKPTLVASPSFEDSKYIKLTNLKKLLDDGVITKEEFDREKAKILN